MLFLCKRYSNGIYLYSIMQDTITTIIVEDEPIIAADLRNQLKRADVEVLDIFEDGESAISYLAHHDVDVILMDIRLQGNMDGIEVAHKVQQEKETPIIFLTSNTDLETLKRAKITSPHAFLSKPFRIKDIINAIELAVDMDQNKNEEQLEFMGDRVFIKQKDSLEKVLYEHIIYIKAEGAYTHVFTKEKSFLLSQTLKKTEANLKFRGLIKVHRSFMVNMKNVDKVTENHLVSSGHKIPMSKTYKESVLSHFKKI